MGLLARVLLAFLILTNSLAAQTNLTFRDGRATGAPPPSIHTMKVGQNLLGFNYFGSEQPFLDRIKQSNGWAGRNATPTATGTQNVITDANGWPTSMKVLGDPSSTFGQIDLGIMINIGRSGGSIADTQLPPYYPSGQYIILYSGDGVHPIADAGTLNCWDGQADGVTNVAASVPGRIVCDVATPSPNGLRIRLTATDPLNTGNYIRNIRIVHSDDEALLLSGEIFSPTFLERLSPFKSVRFMDWNDTLNIRIVNWSDRVLPSHAFWGSGDGDSAPTNFDFRAVPVEIMVALCNKIVAQYCWLNAPPLSNNAYATSFATLVRDTLNSISIVIYEFGNEFWNHAGSNYQAVADLGAIAFPDSTNDFDRGNRYYIKRLVETGQIWKSVWGATGIANRVIRTAGGQHTGGGYNEFVFEKTETYWVGPAKDYFEAFATAPYFGDPVTNTWTQTMLCQEVLTGGVSPPPPGGAHVGGMIQGQIDALAVDLAKTISKGKIHFLYEGGQNFVDYASAGPSPDLNLERLYMAFNRSACMGTAYTSYLDKMNALGNLPLFMNFNLITNTLSQRYWGLLENVLQTCASQPKCDAVKTWTLQ